MRVRLIQRLFPSFVVLFLASCSPKPISSGPTDQAVKPAPEPYQADVPKDVAIQPIVRKGIRWEIRPLDEYILGGKVCSVKRYRWGWGSTISPVDLAVRWGILVNPDVEKKISWSQRGRWYYWRFGSGTSLTNDVVRQNSSNNHIIPASENLLNAVLSMRPNDVVELSGYLVNLTGSKGKGVSHWNSSRTRTDWGDGSCEVFYVTQVIVHGLVYH